MAQEVERVIGPSTANNEVIISVSYDKDDLLRELLSKLGVSSVSSRLTFSNDGNEVSVGINADQLQSKLKELALKSKKK